MRVDRTFEGVVIALMTPMHDDGSVDLEKMKELVEFLINYRIHGLYPCGTSGEGPKLSREERKEIVKTVTEAAHGRVPVFAGGCGASTEDSVATVKDAEESGADAVILLPPYYYKPTKEALLEHYSTVADRSMLPIFLYNVPGFAGYSLPNELIVHLVKEHSIITGVKDSTGNMIGLIELLNATKGEVGVFQGLEPLVLVSLVMGARGCTVSDANIAPQLVVDIFEAFKQGRIQDAVKKQFDLAYLDSHMGYEDFIISTKEALRLLGRPIGPTRRPSSKVKSEDLAKMKQMLQDLGLLK